MTQINDIITDENGPMYADAAIWCNENNALLQEIEPADKARRFKVVPVPEKTDEEKKEYVRFVRDRYLADTDKIMISDYPVTAEKRELYCRYRQYLRDYTLQECWQDNFPKSFEEWSK